MSFRRPPSRSLSALGSTQLHKKPNVQDAKKWMEEVILPRRVAVPGKINVFRMLEMGEQVQGSELYSVWKTTLDELAVFGVGIGLYFRSLLQLGFLFFVLAMVSVPSMVYFLSDAYSGAMSGRTIDPNNTRVDPRVWGTAVCTRSKFKNVSLTDMEIDRSQLHIVEDLGDGFVLVKRNNCPVSMTLLYVDLIALVILVMYMVIAAWIQRKHSALLDEQEQTAADYSVTVKDPDGDARDPDEWFRFFSQFGQVRFVTIALNNDKLLSALAHMRYMTEMLEMESVDKHVVFAAKEEAMYGEPRDIPAWKRVLQRFNMYRNIDYWQRELCFIRKRILEMIRHDNYQAWSVFVMFESERARFDCLSKMKAGVVATMYDSKYLTKDEHLKFRGKNLLQIEEAVEPGSVNWNNIGVRWRTRFLQQLFNGIALILMMVAVYSLISYLKDRYVGGDGALASQRRRNLFIIAYSLMATDMIGCKILYYLDLLERHHTREREQLSKLNKLLVFRFFNGAVVIYTVMSFTDILTQNNILQIQAILIANLTTTPILMLVSPFDRFCQWFIAPYSKTQKRLNQFYSGYYWSLAERYTEITKVVGTALFYKPLLPTGMLITAVSLLVNYWVDKYCLLRMWKVPPKYDGTLAKASRYHILIIALASLIMMGHWYNGWPYDEVADAIVQHQRETWSSLNNIVVRLAITIIPVPLKDEQYYTPLQINMMWWLTLAIVFVTTCVTVVLTIRFVRHAFQRYVTGAVLNSTGARMQPIPFTHVEHIDAYVPQFTSWYSEFPYLCVPLNTFDPKYIDWSGAHTEYSLVNDLINDDQFNKLIDIDRIKELFGVCQEYDENGNPVLRGPISMDTKERTSYM